MEKVENTMGGANTFELEGRIGDLELKLGGNLQEQIKNTTQIFNEKIETVQNSTSSIKNSVSTLIQGELIIIIIFSISNNKLIIDKFGPTKFFN